VRSPRDLVSGAGEALRGLPRAATIDVLVALGAFAALLANPLLEHKVNGLTPVMVILSLLAAIPLVARSRFPLVVLAAEVPLLLACLAVSHPGQAAVGIAMLLVFTVGLEGGRARSLVVGAVMALLVTAAVLLTDDHHPDADVFAYIALVLGALTAGDALRARQELQRVVAEEAVRAGEAAAQHRFDQERLALAHELHDIVGHALVAINVRAAAAARRARKDSAPKDSAPKDSAPKDSAGKDSAGKDSAREANAADGTVALDEIAAVSAGALTELRTTLKALRAAQDGPAPLHPAQDLADLPGLIAGVEEAGLSVRLDVAGIPSGLPAPVGHAGYRIIQESLTNVLRHSTARQARVRVTAGDCSVEIEVLDDGRPHGPAASAAALQAGGHGLAGMRERAAALGGSCEAGPVNGTGWRVRAEIPFAHERA
jgi:signal transduction histidine kinase